MKLRTLVILACIVFLLFGCASAQKGKTKSKGAPPINVQAELQNGINFFSNNDIPNAINSFNKVIQADPNNPAAYYFLGMCLEKQGNNDGALNKYNLAVSKKSEYVDALLAKGNLLVKMKQFANSIEPLNKIIQLFTEKQWGPNPLLGNAYYTLGLAYYNLNNQDLALTNFQNAITINPQHAYAHYFLGMTFYNKNKKDLAIEQLNIFLQLAPSAPEAPQVRSLLAQIGG